MQASTRAADGQCEVIDKDIDEGNQLHLLYLEVIYMPIYFLFQQLMFMFEIAFVLAIAQFKVIQGTLPPRVKAKIGSVDYCFID